MKPSGMVKDAIVNGYEIPLISEPEAAHFPHNKSAREKENKQFLDEDIRSLERSKAERDLDQQWE